MKSDYHTYPSSSKRPSVFKTMELVMRQVEFHCFASTQFKWIDPLYKELCLVIADVLVMDSDAVITVNGTKTPVFLVQEVYSKLNNDHLRLVFKNFKNVTYPVYNKKAYLRTVLYNSVFEIEAHSINASSSN